MKRGRKQYRIPKGMKVRQSLILHKGDSKPIRTAKVKVRQLLIRIANK